MHRSHVLFSCHARCNSDDTERFKGHARKFTAQKRLNIQFAWGNTIPYFDMVNL